MGRKCLLFFIETLTTTTSQLKPTYDGSNICQTGFCDHIWCIGPKWKRSENVCCQVASQCFSSTQSCFEAHRPGCTSSGVEVRWLKIHYEPKTPTSLDRMGLADPTSIPTWFPGLCILPYWTYWVCCSGYSDCSNVVEGAFRLLYGCYLWKGIYKTPILSMVLLEHMTCDKAKWSMSTLGQNHNSWIWWPMELDVSKQKHTPQAFRCLSNMLKLLVALICAVLKILQALGEIIQFKTKVNYENCCFKLLQLLPVVSNIYWIVFRTHVWHSECLTSVPFPSWPLNLR